jgi:pimeloyl-ACP methyl ester carboxylesterase
MPLRVADVVAVLDDLGIERALGISWGGRLCFGVGQHAPERVRSLIAIGQQPYAIDPDGPLARGRRGGLDGVEAARYRGARRSVRCHPRRYPDDVRSIYLACDAEAMRAAWEAAIAEGAVGEDLRRWSVRCLICVAEDDADFFDQAAHAAAEIPNAEFVSIPGTDHLGVDTAGVDPVLPGVLRVLGGST